MTNLTTTFRTWLDLGISIVGLLDHNNTLVGAINLNKIDINNLIVCDLKNNPEKYYIQVDGLSVFFTYYKKMEN